MIENYSTKWIIVTFVVTVLSFILAVAWNNYVNSLISKYSNDNSLSLRTIYLIGLTIVVIIVAYTLIKIVNR